MIYFGGSILKKDPGTLYFSAKNVTDEYSYCWSNNFNVLSKVAMLYGVKIGGIWNGQQWIYSDSDKYKNLLRKYHNV